MKENIVLKTIRNLRYIIGLIMLYIALGTINTNLIHHRPIGRSFEVLTIMTYQIIISLFLIYPLFNKMSKKEGLNFIRGLVGIISLIYSSYNLVEFFFESFHTARDYYGVEVTYLFSNELFYASYLRFYPTYFILSFLLIKPFIRKVKGSWTLDFIYKEANKDSFLSRKVDEQFEKFSVYLSIKLNDFLSKGNSIRPKYNKVQTQDNQAYQGNIADPMPNLVSIKIDEITRINSLLNEGVISEDEFNNLKSQILEKDNEIN